MPTTAIIYARISTDTRGDHLGVARQERLCRELAERQGLTVGAVLVDNDISAYRAKRRPAFEALVETLKAGEATVVLAYHVDRLYRRLGDLERLVQLVEATGAEIHTVAAGDVDLSTASGRMVARMLGAAAQHESERIGERTRMKNDELAAKGSHPGGRPPYGYSSGYQVNKAEAKVVRRAAARVLEGASLLRVTKELNADGVPTREGRRWAHSTLRGVLINPAVAGLRVHRREIAGPGEWEPVLDRDTWEALRAVLADPARKRTCPARTHLLSGLVTNTEGEKMNGSVDITGRPIYTTRTPSKVSTQVRAEPLEEMLVEILLQMFDDAVLPIGSTEERASGGAIEAVEAELAELAELRGAGTISLAEWMAARKPLLRRLECERKAITTTRRTSSKAASVLGRPGALRHSWPSLTFAERREVLQLVIESIVIGPATRGRWTPLPERVNVTWKA